MLRSIITLTAADNPNERWEPITLIRLINSFASIISYNHSESWTNNPTNLRDHPLAMWSRTVDSSIQEFPSSDLEYRSNDKFLIEIWQKYTS